MCRRPLHVLPETIWGLLSHSPQVPVAEPTLKPDNLARIRDNLSEKVSEPLDSTPDRLHDHQPGHCYRPSIPQAQGPAPQAAA